MIKSIYRPTKICIFFSWPLQAIDNFYLDMECAIEIDDERYVWVSICDWSIWLFLTSLIFYLYPRLCAQLCISISFLDIWRESLILFSQDLSFDTLQATKEKAISKYFSVWMSFIIDKENLIPYIYSPTWIPQILWKNRMCSNMPCSNVKKNKNKTSLFLQRIIDTAVGGLDSWSWLQIIESF